MFVFDVDPDRARAELEALLRYLTATATIDGEMDLGETAHILERVLEALAGSGHLATLAATAREALARLRDEAADLLYESVTLAENRNAVLRNHLAERCLEAFATFDPAAREALLALGDDLVLADGHVHPAERELRSRLAEMVRTPPPFDVPTPTSRRAVTVQEIEAPAPVNSNPAFFEWFEFPYSASPGVFRRQADADRDQATALFEALAAEKARGAGHLDGATTVRDLQDAPSFLDGWVRFTSPTTQPTWELTVLGDLHGCYACLKAALLQSRFLDRVAAWKERPGSVPFPLLVALGDYLDRGRFGLDGVLRLLIHLRLQHPEHMVLLRGNHEYLVEHEGALASGVVPAESVEPYVRCGLAEHLRAFKVLFESLPVVHFFGPLAFVHGGPPRDALLRAPWKGLSTLNDPQIRFQLLWSDPSRADVIPPALQEGTQRFAWGRHQALAFLHRIGAHTLVRGHLQVREGFRRHWEGSAGGIYTLFSAGGDGNPELPPRSAYHRVRPMGLQIRCDGAWDGPFRMTTWPLAWYSFISPETNRLLHPPA